MIDRDLKSGKARCFYTFEEKVRSTKTFDVIKFNGFSKEAGGEATGYIDQGETAGFYWTAVAKRTPWGSVPGKARNGKCWYAANGKEHETTDFFYVLSDDFVIAKSKKVFRKKCERIYNDDQH